jgi:antitoxin MazE
MTTQTVKRWGNSLAMRIPAGIAEELNLQEDQEVEVEVMNGVLTATPKIKTFNWGEYLTQLAERPDEVHPTISRGKAVGSELGNPSGENDW